jgi:hypothetical protein
MEVICSSETSGCLRITLCNTEDCTVHSYHLKKPRSNKFMFIVTTLRSPDATCLGPVCTCSDWTRRPVKCTQNLSFRILFLPVFFPRGYKRPLDHDHAEFAWPDLSVMRPQVLVTRSNDCRRLQGAATLPTHYSRVTGDQVSTNRPQAQG